MTLATAATSYADPLSNPYIDPSRQWMHIGWGYKMDAPSQLVKIGFPYSSRTGHVWVLGSNRVGKSRVLEGMVDQDIRSGNSVVVIEPKGDIPLFNKIVQCAMETNRMDDLIFVNPIFPDLSACIDPLASYYMPEELVSHIISAVALGDDPYYYGVAYETALVIVEALIFMAEAEGVAPRFNLEEVYNHVGHEELEILKKRLDYLADDPKAAHIANKIGKIVRTPKDHYSKVASSLRTALTELTSGSIGQIIGKANENKFLSRLEAGQTVIMVVQLGSMLTGHAAYSTGKIILSMIQSFVGRCFASGKKISPALAVYIDEAQSTAYMGFEELLAKGGGADCYITGFCQSISQIEAVIGRERTQSLLDCSNTKIFMRVQSEETAKFVSLHLGEEVKFSPMLTVGGGLTFRDVSDEQQVHPSQVLSMQKREFFMTSYDGIYHGRTADVVESRLRIKFPDTIKAG